MGTTERELIQNLHDDLLKAAQALNTLSYSASLYAASAYLNKAPAWAPVQLRAHERGRVGDATIALVTAARRYLGDREPGQAGGDIADVWAAIEQAEAAVAAVPAMTVQYAGPSGTACDDQNAHEPMAPPAA